MKTIAEFIPKCVTFDKSDIFSFAQDHQIWSDLSAHIERKQLGDPRKIEKEFKKIVRYILLANAIMAKKTEHHHTITQNMAAGFGAIYYFFLSNKAQKKAHVFFADPHAPTAQKVWNLPDSTLIKGIIKMMLPGIDYNKKIFIERDPEDSITVESLCKEIEDGTINKIDEIPKKQIKVTHLDPEEYYNSIFKECNDNSKICIRLISWQKLPNKPKQLNKNPSKIEEFFTNLINKPRKESFCFSDSIIIHIHGGGFIAMSSRSHQTYTRKWANQLKIPIFSIDYRLAPEFAYPAAIDDCWQAYNWILKNVYDLFGKIMKFINLINN